LLLNDINKEAADLMRISQSSNLCINFLSMIDLNVIFYPELVDPAVEIKAHCAEDHCAKYKAK